MPETIIAPSAGAAAGGAGDVVGPAVSVDGEVALYSGVTGKLLKRATGTGITRALAGVYVTPSELSGDVTTSGSNAVTIAADAVSYAKMQNISAASRLLGRGSAAGAGDPEEILLGTNLAMSGTTLNATGGGGSSDQIGVVAADIVHATGSTTPADATGLVFSTTASATEAWYVQLLLYMTLSAGAGSAIDYKFNWLLSGTQTGFWGGQAELGVAVGSVPTAAQSLTGVLIAGGNSTIPTLIRYEALVSSGGSAGTVQLQFSQNSTTAGTFSTMKAMSMLIARKIRS